MLLETFRFILRNNQKLSNRSPSKLMENLRPPVKEDWLTKKHKDLLVTENVQKQCLGPCGAMKGQGIKNNLKVDHIFWLYSIFVKKMPTQKVSAFNVYQRFFDFAIFWGEKNSYYIVPVSYRFFSINNSFFCLCFSERQKAFLRR